MKKVELKKGNKTIIKLVPDDWKPKEISFDLTGDLTTGERKCIGFSDIKQSDWDRIFKPKKHSDLTLQ